MRVVERGERSGLPPEAHQASGSAATASRSTDGDVAPELHVTRAVGPRPFRLRPVWHDLKVANAPANHGRGLCLGYGETSP